MTTGPAFFRSANGGRLHLRDCTHFSRTGSDVVEATAADEEQMPICSACQRTLDGMGRTEHITVEDALKDFGAQAALVPQLAKLLDAVEWDVVAVPFSRSYTAVYLNNVMQAYAGQTYVTYLPGEERVHLAGFASGSGGGAKRPEKLYGRVCPNCGQEMPLTGICDACS